MSKYHSEKTTVNGIRFDSKKEARRYVDLLMLEKAGEIQDLRLQVPFTLIPAQYQTVDGKTRCVEKAVKYIADFTYTENGNTVVEDAKGSRTDVYIIKRKLMLERCGIRIKET